MPDDRPVRTIHASAPIRICDLGGWTDTWFAGQGLVLNIAVEPRVEVQIDVYPRAARPDQVVLQAENYGDRYALAAGPPYGRHPLLEATIAEMGVPDDLALEIVIYSVVPGGASTGTSAAVTVALLAALAQVHGGCLSPHALAERAHAVETRRLGLQSGIQDQLCAAHGGVCLIEMDNYPHARVSQVELPDPIWWELERRLLLVFLGKTHSSSPIHEQVIARLEREGPLAAEIEVLRQAARDGLAALRNHDFDSFGAAMKANTAAQARLHPALIGGDAKRVIEIARQAGALGWKVNGAGGEGGSLTLLCDDSAARQRALVCAIEAADPLYRVIPTTISRDGVRAWSIDAKRKSR
jgi:D-glycero-alpha-D-manno-heptose-7-phosphate kinase